MKTYPIHEMFYSFQGEGCHMGKSAFFVRLFGCPVHCPWCDSAGTWHPKWVPEHVQRLEPHRVAKTASPYFGVAHMIVLTGGEPAIHDLEPLCLALRAEGFHVHLETSGAFPIVDNKLCSWVTVSPKRWKLPDKSALNRADEFKFIIESPEDIDFYWQAIRLPNVVEARPVWLHPEWSHREDPVVLNAITEAVTQQGARYRAGWQIHKLYKADALDPRTLPLAPLGGDTTKGF